MNTLLISLVHNLVIAFMVLFAPKLCAQNYIRYQQIFNRMDEDITSGQTEKCLARLDTIASEFLFIRAQHCIKALQICSVTEDSGRAVWWTDKAFKQGVPLWLLRANTLTNKILEFNHVRPVIAAYDSLHSLYYASINRTLAVRIDALLEKDQRKTAKVNDAFFLWRYTYHYAAWLRNNKKQFRVLKGIIDSFGYPGELLVGLPESYQDSSYYYPKVRYYGPHLVDRRAGTMLIHYFTNRRSDKIEFLMAEVKNGHMMAEHYGYLHDFIAIKKRSTGDHGFYNTWLTDKDSANLPAIELRRSNVGLNSLSADTRNSAMYSERAKNGLRNDSIILE